MLGMALGAERLADRAGSKDRPLLMRRAVRRSVPPGVGAYASAASNAAEEGRAKNRRVELVQR